jgi:hypothetical protein
MSSVQRVFPVINNQLVVLLPGVMLVRVVLTIAIVISSFLIFVIGLVYWK